MWTKITDDPATLPPLTESGYSGDVLVVVDDDGERYVDFGGYYIRRGWVFDNQKVHSGGAITHWHPLPALPESEAP